MGDVLAFYEKFIFCGKRILINQDIRDDAVGGCFEGFGEKKIEFCGYFAGILLLLAA